MLAAAALLGGTTQSAFLALGLTLPGLLLQDSWRFSFFALGRGSQAFLNNMVWALALLPALVLLRVTGHADVFWCLFAWGAAAGVAAAVGALQTRVMPRLSGARGWLWRHRDLGPRYLAENTTLSARTSCARTALASSWAWPLLAMCRLPIRWWALSWSSSWGWAWLPSRRPPGFCVARHGTCSCSASVGAGLAVVALAWGVVLLVALPRGLGHWMLGSIWRPTYPLVLPLILSVMGTCASSSRARACTLWGPPGAACAR